MLNAAIAEFAHNDLELDPEAIAKMLSISMAELARTIGVARNTLAAKPLAPKAELALRPLVKILSIATEMAGSPQRAAIWFKYVPLPSLGTKTAMEHVAGGHPDWVLGHIENVLNGVYA